MDIENYAWFERSEVLRDDGSVEALVSHGHPDSAIVGPVPCESGWQPPPLPEHALRITAIRDRMRGGEIIHTESVFIGDMRHQAVLANAAEFIQTHEAASIHVTFRGVEHDPAEVLDLARYHETDIRSFVRDDDPPECAHWLRIPRAAMFDAGMRVPAIEDRYDLETAWNQELDDLLPSLCQGRDPQIRHFTTPSEEFIDGDDLGVFEVAGVILEDEELSDIDHLPGGKHDPRRKLTPKAFADEMEAFAAGRPCILLELRERVRRELEAVTAAHCDEQQLEVDEPARTAALNDFEFAAHSRRLANLVGDELVPGNGMYGIDWEHAGLDDRHIEELPDRTREQFVAVDFDGTGQAGRNAAVLERAWNSAMTGDRNTAVVGNAAGRDDDFRALVAVGGELVPVIQTTTPAGNLLALYPAHAVSRDLFAGIINSWRVVEQGRAELEVKLAGEGEEGDWDDLPGDEYQLPDFRIGPSVPPGDAVLAAMVCAELGIQPSLLRNPTLNAAVDLAESDGYDTGLHVNATALVAVLAVRDGHVPDFNAGDFGTMTADPVNRSEFRETILEAARAIGEPDLAEVVLEEMERQQAPAPARAASRAR